MDATIDLPAESGLGHARHIGSGGLGDVFSAVRLSTGGTVALKTLRDLADEEALERRVNREISALLSLKGHPHVIGIEELVRTPSGPVLVMEFAPNGSIAGLLSRRGQGLHPAEVVVVGLHTADALAAAHRRNIVHRDIKPPNLLLSDFGHIKVCDFGIAALLQSPSFRQRTSSISYQYASPEELDDGPDVGPASDIYSLGATLLHVILGRPPRQNKQEQLRVHTLPTYGPALRPAMATLVDIVSSCLEESPADRPTADELMRAFEGLATGFVPTVRSVGDDPPRVSAIRPTADNPQPPQSAAGAAPRLDSAGPAALPPVQSSTEWWT